MVESYALGEEIAQLTTPLLITDPGTERFWDGQSRELCERLPGVGELMPPGADERIFDWLEPYLRAGAGELKVRGGR